MKKIHNKCWFDFYNYYVTSKHALCAQVINDNTFSLLRRVYLRLFLNLKKKKELWNRWRDFLHLQNRFQLQTLQKRPARDLRVRVHDQMKANSSQEGEKRSETVEEVNSRSGRGFEGMKRAEVLMEAVEVGVGSAKDLCFNVERRRRGRRRGRGRKRSVQGW